MKEKTNETITWGDRFKMGFMWFLFGGIALALITLIPASIVGLVDEPFRRFVTISALFVGIAGAIYGRYPPGCRN